LLTGVSAVYARWGTPESEPLATITGAQLRQALGALGAPASGEVA